MIGLAYPEISPVMMHLGFVDIRWYSLAYLVGIVVAWFLIWRDIKKYHLHIARSQLDDMMFNITLGIILGGRLFYVLFYNFDMFLSNPLEIFAVWHGGMSFHGGLCGAVLAMYYSSKKMHYPFFGLTDLAALYAPIGLFLGRCANFINDELFGRVTDVSWAVRFPNGGYLPRHPSQIYEALLEGIALFVVLNLLFKSSFVRSRQGFVSGVFLSFYAVCRMFVEFFREPDSQLGFVYGFVTMGQLLSLPLLIIGILIIVFSLKTKSKL